MVLALSAFTRAASSTRFGAAPGGSATFPPWARELLDCVARAFHFGLGLTVDHAIDHVDHGGGDVLSLLEDLSRHSGSTDCQSSDSE